MYKYRIRDQIVPAENTVAIFGCYLDLVEHTKENLADKYGDCIINVYISTPTYQEIYTRMILASEFGNFAEGSEIIDHKEGLTLFL